MKAAVMFFVVLLAATSTADSAAEKAAEHAAMNEAEHAFVRYVEQPGWTAIGSTSDHGPSWAREQGARPATTESRTAVDSHTAGFELTASRLLELYAGRLLDRSESADVSAVTAELERLEASSLPTVRVSQQSSWRFDELLGLGFNAEVSWDVWDPTSEAQRLLTAKRVALVRLDEESRRESQIREFHRTLRLLAHLNEVEALLSRHRRDLLALRPQWLELDRLLTGVARAGAIASIARVDHLPSPTLQPVEVLPAATDTDARQPSPVAAGQLDGERLGYLQMVQALERTRRERSLLSLIVAERVGLDAGLIEDAHFSRPTPALVGHYGTCSMRKSAESVRAGLVLEEAAVAQRLARAKTLPKVSLDLTGNARYTHSAESPWNADVRFAVRVALPAVQGIRNEASVAVTPTGFSEELSVAWPPAAADTADPAAAELAYRRTLERIRLDALRDLGALEDARDNLRLRRAELAVARGLPVGRAVGVAGLNGVAQAELALLNAELEVDLALLEAAATCGNGTI